MHTFAEFEIVMYLKYSIKMHSIMLKTPYVCFIAAYKYTTYVYLNSFSLDPDGRKKHNSANRTVQVLSQYKTQ